MPIDDTFSRELKIPNLVYLPVSHNNHTKRESIVVRRPARSSCWCITSFSRKSGKFAHCTSCCALHPSFSSIITIATHRWRSNSSYSNSCRRFECRINFIVWNRRYNSSMYSAVEQKALNRRAGAAISNVRRKSCLDSTKQCGREPISIEWICLLTRRRL